MNERRVGDLSKALRSVEQLTEKETSSSYELWRPLLGGGKHLFRASGGILSFNLFSSFTFSTTLLENPPQFISLITNGLLP